jgi:hypothetical protein
MITDRGSDLSKSVALDGYLATAGPLEGLIAHHTRADREPDI